ncbi:hypothetical protein D3C81_1817800 [compost metagenome]
MWTTHRSGPQTTAHGNGDKCITSTAMRSEADQRGSGPSDVLPQSNRTIRSPMRSTGAGTGGCRMTFDAGSGGVPFATTIVTPAWFRESTGAPWM